MQWPQPPHCHLPPKIQWPLDWSWGKCDEWMNYSSCHKLLHMWISGPGLAMVQICTIHLPWCDIFKLPFFIAPWPNLTRSSTRGKFAPRLTPCIAHCYKLSSVAAPPTAGIIWFGWCGVLVYENRTGYMTKHIQLNSPLCVRFGCHDREWDPDNGCRDWRL